MHLERRPAPWADYIEALDRVLDKGIVIDVSARVSLLAIDLLRVDVRVVVTSFEADLRHGALLKPSAAWSDAIRGVSE